MLNGPPDVSLTSRLLRLGVYTDIPFQAREQGLAAAVPFARYLEGLSSHVAELVIFARVAPRLENPPVVLRQDNIRLAALPFYPRLTDLGSVLRAIRGSRRVFVDALPSLDAVLLFGPHPVAALFAHLAQRAGVPVLLGVRQDFPRYVNSRLPSAKWRPAMIGAYALEFEFRRLAHGCPTIVAGNELGRKYGRTPKLMTTGFSLVSEGDLVDAEEIARRSVAPEPVVLSVGRLDVEKNPLLLADVLAHLLRRRPTARLLVVGEGPLAGAVLGRARELGVDHRLTLLGTVSFGPALLAHYRGADALLHVSNTEGLPQVLYEAMAAGLPIVATDVGGVAGALDCGRLGLLVPPADAPAAAQALDQVLGDAPLRLKMALAGLDRVATETLQAQTERVAAMVLEAVDLHHSRAGIERGRKSGP